MVVTPWAVADEARLRLRGTRRVDVAVVGAGLTGLSAALELLELDPDLRVAVVDAAVVGAGASGRGTGLLGPRVGPALTRTRKRHGDDVARAAYLWSVSAVRHALDLVSRYEIACDLVPGSQLVVAADEAGARAQEAEAAAAHALGLPITLVTGNDLPPVAAGFASGLRYAPAATLDPAALTAQLARAGEKRGLTIYERTRVRRIRGGLLTSVVTDGGEIHADNVVVGTNAFGADLGVPRGVVGVTVQAGVTEPLPDAVLAEVAGLRTEPLIGAAELSPYYRLTEDRRLVVGGGVVRGGTAATAAPAPGRLRAAVRALSPALAGTRIEATWAGPVGMTTDGLPVVGRHPGDSSRYYAGGCNGHGLAVSLHSGAFLARWIVNGDKDELSFALPWVRSGAPWVPRGRLADRVLDRYLAHLTTAAGRRPTGPRTRGEERHGHP
ncbi:NAD(P)/FAD-dependent oxidoreductase [Actinophytocola sp.]|uniref:NAD(P)/FAD-dependent oxidoreductase n=1 Tax=Actinophytocola sp. TaxID=1872138 RepID=UPI003D6B2E06